MSGGGSPGNAANSKLVESIGNFTLANNTQASPVNSRGGAIPSVAGESCSDDFNDSVEGVVHEAAPKLPETHKWNHPNPKEFEASIKSYGGYQDIRT